MNRDETPASGVMPPAPKRRRPFLRLLPAVVVAVLLLCVFHAPLLRGVWNFLVVAVPLTDKWDVLAVRVADIETIRGVVELHGRGLVDHVLLPPAEVRTTDALGLTEPTPAETRRELATRGVPGSQVEDLPADGVTLRRIAHGVADYLRRHPERRLTIVTPRLQGRNVRRVVNEVLDDEAAARVTYFSVAPQQYDETRWWTARLAVQQVFQAYVQWATEVTTDLPQFLEAKIDWQAFEAAVTKGEKP